MVQLGGVGLGMGWAWARGGVGPTMSICWVGTMRSARPRPQPVHRTNGACARPSAAPCSTPALHATLPPAHHPHLQILEGLTTLSAAVNAAVQAPASDEELDDEERIPPGAACACAARARARTQGCLSPCTCRGPVGSTCSTTIAH